MIRGFAIPGNGSEQVLKLSEGFFRFAVGFI